MFDYKKHFLYAPDEVVDVSPEEVSDSPILPRAFNGFPEWNNLVVVPYDGMNPSTKLPIGNHSGDAPASK